MQNRITVARRIVEDFRERLHADLGRVGSDWKKDGSRVTETDHAISAGILSALAKEFPDDVGLSEELATRGPVAVTSRFAWVLDPIDGTNNFALGLAQCAISLALLEAGQPVYGIIYDASRRVILHGGPGRGVWDGNRAAKVHQGGLRLTSTVGFHSPHKIGSYPGHGERMITHCKVRAMGSSALHLAYVAVGLLEGVVDHNVKLWDIAAGIAMIRGAGEDVTFLDGNPLPLRTFDLDMSRIVYVGGCARMRADLRDLLPMPDPVAGNGTA
jgi:myo-inositol-1(or 4)-monophosphatase